jgi:hypothetical protein
VRSFRDAKSYAGKSIIYGGSGNIRLMKKFSARFTSRILREVERLIILPHAIKDVDPLLVEFGPNVDIICREWRSYEYVKIRISRVQIFLADDMTIGLNTSELLHYILEKPEFLKRSQ